MSSSLAIPTTVYRTKGYSGVNTPCENSPFAYRPGLCTSKSHCTLGEVPITQEIRANKAWGSGAESMGGNPYGPYRELDVNLRAISSAGLEHLPYKQGVDGSNPSSPTSRSHAREVLRRIS